MPRKAALSEIWIVQPFQHGTLDGCEAPDSFASEADAIAAAREWAEDVCYDKDTEHECVVFKAVASFRGKKTVSQFDPVLAKPKTGN